jgi:hypothetical protein
MGMLRFFGVLLFVTGLVVFNASCVVAPRQAECEKRVIVHFLQPVTNEQGLEIVRSVLAQPIKKGLQVNFRIQVDGRTAAYSLSAAGCASADQAIETLRQATGSRIRLLELDAPMRIMR